MEYCFISPREVEAPTGYVKASDTEFKLDDCGIITKISGNAQHEMIKHLIYIILNKLKKKFIKQM